MLKIAGQAHFVKMELCLKKSLFISPFRSRHAPAPSAVRCCPLPAPLWPPQRHWQDQARELVRPTAQPHPRPPAKFLASVWGQGNPNGQFFSCCRTSWDVSTQHLEKNIYWGGKSNLTWGKGTYKKYAIYLKYRRINNWDINMYSDFTTNRDKKCEVFYPCIS